MGYTNIPETFFNITKIKEHVGERKNTKILGSRKNKDLPDEERKFNANSLIMKNWLSVIQITDTENSSGRHTSSISENLPTDFKKK